MEPMTRPPDARAQVSAMCGKALGPLLSNLEGGSATECAAALLSTVLRVAPGSARAHYARASTLVTSALFSSPEPGPWAATLALLPHVGGPTAWPELAAKTASELHATLGAMIGGADSDSALASSAKDSLGHRCAALPPPSAFPPPHAWGPARPSPRARGARPSDPDLRPPRSDRPEEAGALSGLDRACSGAALAARCSALLQLLERMLEGPSPGPVPLPSRAVLLAAARLLSCRGGGVADGDVAAALGGLTAQVARLAGSLLRAAGKSAAPFHASLLGVVAAALREEAAARGARAPGVTVRHAESRAALYDLAGELFRAAGAAVAARCAPWAVAAARAELYAAPGGAGGGRGGGGAAGAGRGKKRARDGATPASLELAEGSAEALAEAEAMESLGSARHAGALGAQAAALRMLGAACDAAGGMIDAGVRADLDAVCAHAAAASAQAVAARAGAGLLAGAAAVAGLHAAALDALASSVLAPCGSRAPHLPQALALLRRAAAAPHGPARAAAACRLPALEALLHPRGQPLPGAYGGPGGGGAAAEAYEAGAREAAPLPKPRFWHGSAGLVPCPAPAPWAAAAPTPGPAARGTDAAGVPGSDTGAATDPAPGSPGPARRTAEGGGAVAPRGVAAGAGQWERPPVPARGAPSAPGEAVAGGEWGAAVTAGEATGAAVGAAAEAAAGATVGAAAQARAAAAPVSAMAGALGGGPPAPRPLVVEGGEESEGGDDDSVGEIDSGSDDGDDE